MENPFADMLVGSKIPDYSRLSFEEQCAFYVALLPYKVSTSNEYQRFPPAAVAAAAGVSQSTISLLSDAGKLRGGQVRYPKVAREYQTLGHEAFVHKYLTPIIRERLAAALEDWKARKRNPDINAKGYNPRADSACGRHDRPETSIDLPAVFYIQLMPDRGGYFWRNLKPRHDLPEVPVSQADCNGPYPTSQDAKRAALAYLDPKL